jgi:hypothetical protein
MAEHRQGELEALLSDQFQQYLRQASVRLLTYRDLLREKGYDFNHRNALLSYFRARGIQATETGDVISAELPNGERLVAVFDAEAQVRTINGDIMQPLKPRSLH